MKALNFIIPECAWHSELSELNSYILLLLLLKDNPSFNEIGVGAPDLRNNVL